MTPQSQQPAKTKRVSKLSIISSATSPGFKVDVLAYNKLAGSNDPATAQSIYYANQTGLKLKQVRISLEQGDAIAEAGTLHYMHGNIELSNPVGGVGGLGKAMMKKMLTNETAFMPRYKGTGEIFLEPSFGDFLIYQLNNETIIADKGLFYCGAGTVKTGVAAQKNVSSALFGGEGFFQTKIEGSGICVFELPVPADEVRCIPLNNETLQVDGNFALMRSGRIDFSVERSAKGIMGSMSSGEGLLQTFRGTGRVWLAPTQSVYDRLRFGGVSSLSSAVRSSNTRT
ncbi:MAG: AIM24 family protein [Cyanobacteria bacterium J06598_3]